MFHQASSRERFTEADLEDWYHDGWDLVSECVDRFERGADSRNWYYTFKKVQQEGIEDC